MKRQSKLYLIAIWIFLIVVFNSLKAQQVNYVSQVDGLQGIWFPAFSAFSEAPSIGFYNRSRWLGFSEAPNTNGLVALVPLKNWKAGLHANAELEINGGVQYSKIAGGYSYKIPFDYQQYNSLGFGIGMGGYQFSIDMERLVKATSAADPLLVNSADAFTNLFFNIGVNWKSFLGPGHDDQFTLAVAYYKPVVSGEKSSLWIEEKEAFFGWLEYQFGSFRNIYFGPRLTLNYFNNQFLRSDLAFYLGIQEKVEFSVNTFEFRELGFSLRLSKGLIDNLPIALQVQFGSSIELNNRGLDKASTFEFAAVYYFE